MIISFVSVHIETKGDDDDDFIVKAVDDESKQIVRASTLFKL